MSDLATYVRRQRVRGWRMPVDGISCTRTRATCAPWGNPFRVGDLVGGVELRTPADAVAAYRRFLRGRPDIVAAAVRQLTGHPLLCWCGEGSPCHVQDVLMPLVNEGRLP